MISQLSLDCLYKLFSDMDLEDRAQLYMMVDASLGNDLKSVLNDDEKKDLFLYSHFELTNQTKKTSSQFIEELV